MNILEREREFDSIDAAQNAPPHHTIKKNIKKEDTTMMEKWKKERSELKSKTDKSDEEVKESQRCSEEEEAVERNDSNSDCDHDGDALS